MVPIAVAFSKASCAGMVSDGSALVRHEDDACSYVVATSDVISWLLK